MFHRNINLGIQVRQYPHSPHPEYKKEQISQEKTRIKIAVLKTGVKNLSTRARV
jgi:hypothetical protein